MTYTAVDPSRLAVDSDAVAEDWIQLMRRGDFEAAWKFSDRVLESRRGRVDWTLPRHTQSIWNGSSLEGKRVLIRCYHGLGDTVQFIRYASEVKAIAADVTVWAQPELLPLLKTVSGIDHLLPLHDGSPEVPYDVDVEVMELPHIFRSTIGTIPTNVPYIAVEPADEIPVSPPGSGKAKTFNVGLVWQAGAWDPRRSLQAETLFGLADIPGVRLHLLQRGPALKEWIAAKGIFSGSDDTLEAAGVIKAMDLVITVDSFPAHLAGALGVPTWLLLHSDPDWRWLLDLSDSPWYPTMRLFRQQVPGDWSTVLKSVQRELCRLGADTDNEAGRLV